MRILSVAVVLGLVLGCSEYNVEKGPPTVDLGDDTDAPDDPDGAPPTGVATPIPTPPASAPDIEVEPLVIPFGYLPAQCSSEPDVVTVRNVGGGDLVVDDIDWVDNDGAFTHSGSSIMLAPGESYQLFVEFQPPADGERIDALRISSNDPDESEVDVAVDGTGASNGTLVETFTQNVANQVDVLFVLDNSGSMSDNLDELGARFPAFINGFFALGLDYQIGLVTTDMDNPAQSGRLLGPVIDTNTPDPVAEFVAQSNTGSSGSSDERGLDAAFAALDPSMGLITTTNAGLVRPGSNLSIIVVSDEDDSSGGTAGQFVGWLNQLQGDPDLTSLSIVGGPRGGLFPCFSFFGGTSAAPVPRYWNVARNSDGIHGDLCATNFTPILDRLATVAAGLREAFQLQNDPDPATIEVAVDGQLVAEDPANGWTYDGPSNAIVFHGAAVPLEGEVVEVLFDGQTVCP